ASHSSPSMKSFFIAPPVGGGRSRKSDDRPLVALRYRRRSSGCASSIAGDWDSGNPAFALSRGSRGASPSASSSDPRFSDMLLSPPAFALTWPTILQTHRSPSRLPFPGPVFEIAPAEAVSQAEPRGYAAIIRG